MTDTTGPRNTKPADETSGQRGDQHQQLAHADDAENAKRVVPNQAMRTQNITTAEDAAFDDQRQDRTSVKMRGTKTGRSHENLGTPVNAPTPVEERRRNTHGLEENLRPVSLSFPLPRCRVFFPQIQDLLEEHDGLQDMGVPVFPD